MRRIFPIFCSVAACVLLGCHTRNSRFVLDAVTQLPADGREHRLAYLRSQNPESLHVSGLPAASVHFAEVKESQVAIFVRAPVTPQIINFSVSDGHSSARMTANLTADNLATADGTPDWMRLHLAGDRGAFRLWFTELADQAADTPADKLPREITDCASLVRYAFREALRLHDDRWYAQFPAGQVPSLPSVKQWTYPTTPLGANLFRTRPGPFVPDDLRNGTFTQFADAKTLHFDNAYLLGRDLRLARPGDLIFYRVLETNSQYHSMIITGERGEWVVYNTGPDHGHQGEMRRVLFSDLLHHPDPKWRPEAANPNWLGVYRWNILRED